MQLTAKLAHRKLDELSYHQTQHNVSCSIMVDGLGSLQSCGVPPFISQLSPFLSQLLGSLARNRLLRIGLLRVHADFGLSSVAETNHSILKTPVPPHLPLSEACSPERKSAEDPGLSGLLAIRSSPVQTPLQPKRFSPGLKYLEKETRISVVEIP